MAKTTDKDTEIEVGTVAFLKGSSLSLSVFKLKDVDGEPHAECFWVDQKDAPHKALIPIACLSLDPVGMFGRT